MIMASTFYLTHKLADNSSAVTRNAELAKLIDVAQDVRNTFGEYRYWVTDLAAALVMANADATGRTKREKIITANPFLERFTVADLGNWADRKMQVPRS